ncbi:MAG TPA: hypothetical protein VIH14_00305 [Anaerolineales bacterium]
MEEMKHESLEEHIRGHVNYPASRDQILTSCLAEGFSKEEAEMANSHLQDKTYNSAEEVMEALHHMHKH